MRIGLFWPSFNPILRQASVKRLRSPPSVSYHATSGKMTIMAASSGGSPHLTTEVLRVDSSKILKGSTGSDEPLLLENWHVQAVEGSEEALNLQRAAQELRETDIPVAFPTETVYGLGADVTRSSAVLGIFKAKQRPSDNPLIVHISTLQQLRTLLNPNMRTSHEHIIRDCQNGTMKHSDTNGHAEEDPIPAIYRPLIQKFWPGPLSLIMPNPAEGSLLAPEVTAGLQTFGVRMPRSNVALALITMAGVPLAAPSANASTKPSTTTAAHVKKDLDGRISTIIDGGACDVGVESTVVDGLSDPPLILRPGGISMAQLRTCPGWENVRIGYKDASEKDSKPKAPGMKYKHYSPRARVILYEDSKSQPNLEDMVAYGKHIGIIRTRNWTAFMGLSKSAKLSEEPHKIQEKPIPLEGINTNHPISNNFNHRGLDAIPKARQFHLQLQSEAIDVWDIDLGSKPEIIARGLFSALRELDEEDVDAILVEGIDDRDGDVTAAVMNRLRKAAETKIVGGTK